MELAVLLVLCVCCFGGALGAEPSGQASGSQLQVNVCHLSGGRYRLLRIATSAWPGHARLKGDCCLNAAVCGARRCGSRGAPWKINAKTKTCTPTCPVGSTWDTSTLRCLPQRPLMVNMCHLSRGRYRLLRIDSRAWTGHARHTGDCCLNAAVCGARRCGTPQLPWKVDAKRRTCIPTCPANSTWDTATSSCLPAGPCASDPCAATKVLRANGTCFTDSGASSGYSCGCVTGATWSNGECVDDDGCAAASGACAADQPGNFANGTCIDAPAPSTGFSCGCITGATWSDMAGECVDDDGCAATDPCEGVAGSNGTCLDEAAPKTGYTCACDAGRLWNGTACADDDGCAAPNPCQGVAGSNGTCLDEPAPNTGYTCACDAGRAWTGTACADDDGCAAFGGTCDANNANGTCIDAPAPSTGFSCGCITGATWSDMDGDCVDDDGCAATNHCEGVAGSNGTCLDEAAPNTGYTCACDAGRSWNGTACADVDGCAGSNPCGEPRDVCTDVLAPGTGFTCGCATGLAWDGVACVACVSVIAGVTGLDVCNGEGLANESSLNNPTSVSVDAAGNVYIADTGCDAVRKVTAATGTITRLVGSGLNSLFFVRSVLAGFNSSVYIGSSFGQLYNYSGVTSTASIIEVAGGNGNLFGLAIHPVSGVLHVVAVLSGGGSSEVYTVNSTEPTSATLVTNVAEYLSAIAFNASGEAFFAAPFAGRIYKWGGSASAGPLLWNTGSTAPTAGAVATTVVFNEPNGLAIDSAGNMLVSDRFAHRVWLVEGQTGMLRLVAGTGSNGPIAVDGSPTETELAYPTGVAFGPDGRSVFIADSGNHRVLRVMLECVGA